MDNLCEYDGVIVKDFSSFKSFLEIIGNKDFRLVLRLESDDDLNKILDFIFSVGNLSFVAEEVDFISSAWGDNPNFSKILKYGRHKNINLICISRRPAEISKLLTSQSDEIISFRQNEERDLDYLSKRGFDKEKLKSLKDFEYLTIN